jgi:pimeloyl-ACP methyl ester carboxylesterase
MPSNQSSHKGRQDRRRYIEKQKAQKGPNKPPEASKPTLQPARADQAPAPPPAEATSKTERGNPREEYVSMQPASSSTTTLHTHHHKVRSIHYSLSYTLQGEEHGTDGAILLLHGLPGDSFSWRHISPALAAKRAVYAFDMLCYGKSDHPWPADVSIWGQADVLAPCLRALDLSNMVLVGYDVGGGVAQVLATRMAAERVKAIVLISSTCYAQAFGANWPLSDMLKRQEPDAPHHTSIEQLTTDLKATFPQGAANPKVVTHDMLEHYLAPWASEVGKENLFQHIRKQLPNYSMSVASDMKWVNKPVLIIWGEKDEVLSPAYAERLHEDIPGSLLALLPNTGHLILEEAPNEVARLISDFSANL